MPPDILDTQEKDTTQTQTTTPPAPPPAQPPTFTWKSHLQADYANSPTMQKYQDTKEGFNDAVRAHLELQRLMGHERVPIPKGPDDQAAWTVFKQAFRIPGNPEGYGLEDVSFPEALKDVSKGKTDFAKALLKYNLTPEQAKGLWKEYADATKAAYNNQVKAQQDAMANLVTQLRSEWGDAYDSKVELGQMVINKFSEDQETNDWVTTRLVKDPRGIKFLTKIGEQFAENKVGDFKFQRFALTAEDAQKEIDAIRLDKNHPYNNEKASRAERDRAISYVNSLYGIIQKAKTPQ